MCTAAYNGARELSRTWDQHTLSLSLYLPLSTAPSLLLTFPHACVAHLNIYVIGLKFQFACHKNCTNVCAKISELQLHLPHGSWHLQLATDNWARIKYLNRLPFPCPTAMILEQLRAARCTFA